MKFRIVKLALATIVLGGCSPIWNAGDLAKWVETQAAARGCDPESIKLAEWYDTRNGTNTWPVSCLSAESGDALAFSVNIDKVWSPSEPAAAALAAAKPDSAVDNTPATLSDTTLASNTYSGVYDRPVTLQDGIWTGAPYVEGGASRPTLEYLPDSARQGDLDGDGIDDAIVFLVARGGGSGAFLYVAAQLNRDGRPVDAGAILVEDRAQVMSSAIADGIVTLELTTQGPGDAACCGTHKRTLRYALEQDSLVELPGDPEQSLERISFADLEGTHWTLTEINYNTPALGGRQITAFFESGQIRGTGGCNTYASHLTLDETNPFVMTTGPVSSTKMACEAVFKGQENIYLSALDSALQWSFVVGNLAIYYQNAHEKTARLLFEPATTTDQGNSD